MALSVGSVVAEFKANTRNLERGVQRVNRSISGVQQRLGKFRQDIRDLQPQFQQMGMAGGAAFGGIAVGIGKMVKKAGDAQEVQNRFNTIFQENEKQMNDWAKSMGKEFGRAESTVQSLGSTLGGTLMAGTDLATEKIVGMTKETSKAAIKYAAYDDRIKNAEEAQVKFTKALTGNAGPLQELGFNVDKAARKQKALEMGLIESGEELDANSEALATNKLILEQTSTAQEAYEKNKNSLTEKTIRLKEAFKQAQEQLGDEFKPEVKALVDNTKNAIRFIVDWIKNNKNLAKNIIMITGLAAGLTAVVGALGIAINILLSPITLVVGAIAALSAVFVIAWRKSAAFQNIVRETGQTLVDWFNSSKDTMMSMWEAAKPLLVDFLTVLGRLWNRMIGDLQPALKNIGKAFNTLSGFVRNNAGVFKFIAGVLGGVVMAAILAVVSVVKNTITTITGVISGFVTYFRGLIMFFKGAVNFIVGMVTGNTQKMEQAVYTMTRGILQNLKGFKDIVFAIFGGLVKTVVDFFRGLWNALVGNSIVPDIVNGIIAWFRSLPGRIWHAVRGIAGTIGQAFNRAKHRAIDALWGIFHSVRDFFFNKIPNQIQGAAGSIGSSIQDAIPSPNFGVPGFAEGVRNFGGGLGLVGENGPELLRMPKGTDIFSNEKTQKMLNQSGENGEKNKDITVQINNPTVREERDINQIARQVRDTLEEFRREKELGF